MRKEVLVNRALYDKGRRGFVSWVKAYSKHQASSIFRVADLDWTEPGNAWGLVRLPKMPELKNWKGDRSLGVKLNMAEYAYKDKIREKARRVAMEEGKTKEPFVPSEEMVRKRKEREAWREKKRRKREAERLESMTEEERVKEEELQGLLKQVKEKVTEEENEVFEGFDD
jgi:ATP-dependent RNA helicase DDX55/SPB4